MSDRVDILLLELLDLARGQRVALKKGDIDTAVELHEKRQGIIVRIQSSGRVKRAPRFLPGPGMTETHPGRRFSGRINIR
jgi:hypothetical protein